MRRGDAELEADRFAEACQHYLSATERYWLAMSEQALPVAERRRLESVHVSAFRAAVPMLPHPATPFTFQVRDVAVTGYLFRPTGAASGSTTVVWPLGAGATAEAGYWQVAVPVLDAGTACAVFTASPSTEPVLSAVTRWVRDQPGVGEVIGPAVQST